MMRLLLNNSLSVAGYRVVEAVDGVDALDKLKSGVRVNLIICDVNMPNMDGLQFVRTYRADPALQYIPVLMLTTETSQDRKEEGKAAGVRAWMVKPFDPPKLLSAIEKLAVL